MKKLLIVPSWQVWPLRSGGAHAQTVFLNDLSRAFNVHMTIRKENCSDIQQASAAFPNVTFHVYPEPNIQKNGMNFHQKIISKFYHRFILSARSKPLINQNHNSYIIKRSSHFFDPDTLFGAWISQLHKRHDFDIVQFEMDSKISTALECDLPKARKFLVLHELPQLLITQILNLSDISVLNARAIKASLENYLSNSLTYFNKVIVFNENERISLYDLNPAIKTQLSPFTLNTNSDLKIINTRNQDIRGLCFLGGGHHYPNYHGLKWFLEKSWPQIHSSLPDLTLNVVGNWPISMKLSLESQNVVFHNELNSRKLNEILSINILISPVLIGSGLRTKLLECAMKGIPFLASDNEKKCLINVDKSFDYLFFKSEEELTDKVLYLMRNQNEVHNFSKVLFDWFNESYDYKKLLQIRELTYY